MRFFRVGALALSAALALQSAAMAASLGVAGNYNAFIFQNMNETSDSQGAVAVGGNMISTSYSVASNLGNTGTNLVVGGTLTFNGGSINGSAIVGGDTTMNSGGPTGDLTTGGNYSGTNGPTNGGTIYYVGSYNGPSWENQTQVSSSSVTLPIDFAAAQTQLLQTSATLGTLANTGAVSDSFGTYTFTGNNPGLNVFSIDASALASATIQIDLAPGAFALINVTGDTSVILPNRGFSFTGSGDASDVLWNLNGVDSVSMQSFAGSILAPSATVSFSSGQLDGGLIADNLSGGGELHNELFSHDIPTPPSVPLPMSAFTGTTLLAAMAIVRRKRRAGDKGRAPIELS